MTVESISTVFGLIGGGIGIAGAIGAVFVSRHQTKTNTQRLAEQQIEINSLREFRAGQEEANKHHAARMIEAKRLLDAFVEREINK